MDASSTSRSHHATPESAGGVANSAGAQVDEEKASAAEMPGVSKEKGVEPFKRRTKDFGFLPIPRHLQYDPERPFEFTMFLNAIFAAAATFTVANLYYSQPILVQMAEYFDVTHEEVTRCLTFVQLGYLTALIFVAPLADILYRRSLLLFIIFMGGSLTIGQATHTTTQVTKSFAAFQGLSYVVGIFTVVPQILNPLAADMAPPHRRAACVSIVITGLITGMLFARITAGLFAKFSQFKYVYWMAVGLQYATCITFYFTLPDYPRKTTTNYLDILKSMAIYVVTEPLLIQAMLVVFLSTSVFVSWWTNLTFLLDAAPYNYNPFIIGLFGLCGIVCIVLAPQLGRLVDRLNPWTGTLLGLLVQVVMVTISVTCAKYSLGPIIIVSMFTDVAHQLVQIGNQVRVYSINPLARGRLNGCYGSATFCGQLLGSSVGPKVFIQNGWRAAYGLSLGWIGAAVLILCLRGPHAKGWVGWGGVYSIRKVVPEKKEKDVEEQAVDESQASTVVEEPEVPPPARLA